MENEVSFSATRGVWIMTLLAAGCTDEHTTPPVATPAPVVLPLPAPPALSSASSVATAADAASASSAARTQEDEGASPGAAPGFALVLAETPEGKWSGVHSNAPVSITGIWGAGGHVFAVGSGTILHSADRGLHWTSAPGPSGWVAVWGSSLDDVYIAGDAIVRSTDRGATWTAVTAAPASVDALWGSGPDDVYAVANSPPIVVRSRDHGKTWKKLTVPVSADWLYDVAGTGPRDVWVAGKGKVDDRRSPLGYHTTAVLARSTDGGTTWKKVLPTSTGMTDNEEIRNLCFSASGLLFASYSYGVFSSGDSGASWRFAVGGGGEILGLGCSGREILVGARNRNFRHSSDDGATWTSNDLDSVWIDPALITLQATFVADGGEAYVGGESYKERGKGTLLRRGPR
jgi:hypothetical protein